MQAVGSHALSEFGDGPQILRLFFENEKWLARLCSPARSTTAAEGVTSCASLKTVPPPPSAPHISPPQLRRNPCCANSPTAGRRRGRARASTCRTAERGPETVR